jgi:type I restriction enzyme S subunit
MGSEWLEFGGCAELIKESINPGDIDPDTPYIGLEHIDQGTLHLNGFGRAGEVTSNKYWFNEGDILFGKLRPYFRKVVCAPFAGVCSTDIWVVRATEKCDQAYLYYWMASQEFVDIANQGSEGTKMPRAKWDHVCKIKKLVPYILEQERIGRILTALDDKITLNQRMNETLEAMARALFKAWFVDFEPVKAKMNGTPYALPDEIMDLFPDELVESELGMIPKGWKVGKLGDEFEITMGQSPPGSTYNEIGEGLPFYQGNRDFGFRFPSNRMFCSEPARIANPGDTLVSVRAPIGDINMANEKCCIGRGVASIRHKNINSPYTYYQIKALQSSLNQFEGEGTVFGSISKSSLTELKVVYSLSEDLALKFMKLIHPIDIRIENSCRQTNLLTHLLDYQLCDLLKGDKNGKKD